MTSRGPGQDREDRDAPRERDYTEFGFSELGKADALDRYLDGELDRDSAAFRAAFVKRSFRQRLDEMEEILGGLEKAPKGPDLTESILGAVDERRPFVAVRTRRYVTMGRLAAAASVLLAIGVGVLVERARPGVLRLQEEAAPLSVVMSAAGLPAASVPARGEDARNGNGNGAGRGARAGSEESELLGRLLRPLSRVVAVEVRRAGPPAEGLTDAWARAASVRSAASWDRGLWRVPDRTIDESAGLETFPVLEGEQRAWFAAVR